jgi:hypothetical protein
MDAQQIVNILPLSFRFFQFQFAAPGCNGKKQVFEQIGGRQPDSPGIQGFENLISIHIIRYLDLRENQAIGNGFIKKFRQRAAVFGAVK